MKFDKLQKILEGYTREQVYETDDGRTYSVSKLIDLANTLRVVEMPLHNLKKQTHQDSPWGSKTIAQSLEDRADAIDDADPNDPILMAPNGDIADGNHRLAKALKDGRLFVLVQRFASWDQMKPALVDK